MTFFIGNSNELKLKGLTNNTSGAFINDAAVSVMVKDTLGVNVAGETWPKLMSYVASSDGDYSAVLSEDMDLTAGTCYVAEVTAVGGPGLVGFWSLHFIATERRL